MATSLTSQLQNLRTSAARHLTVEKRHVSLIFDKKEAGKLTNETAHRIGVAGLEQMKRIDPVFDTEIANDLFSEEKINFVRSMVESEENEKLNQKINKLLFELSPYLQHFACQQVLEYLVHTFQIYSFNAEMLILTFLPFHETKVYSRILRILDFDWSRSKEWQFMQQFLKSETPIPFTSVVKATMSSSHSIITCITDHIKKGVEVVGSDYLEVKHPMLFNFHAKLLLNLFNDPEKVDEMMLSKLMPFIENGIKSAMTSFRYSALMLISQLVLTVKLKEDILNTLVKLLITKIRVETAPSSVATLLVVFQQQNIDSFSKKTLQKLLRTGEEMGFWKSLRELSTRTDTTKLYLVLWKDILSFVRNSEEESEDVNIALNVLTETTSEISIFTANLAQEFLNSKGNVRAIASKFVKQFDSVSSQFSDSSNIVKHYSLENIEQFNHEEEDIEMENAVPIPTEAKPLKISASEKATNLAGASEFAKREIFVGDPINMAQKWLKEENWSKIDWALTEMANRPVTYFKKKTEDEVDGLIVKLIKLAGVEKNKNLDVGNVKNALSNVRISVRFVNDLITRFDGSSESAPKKAKVVGAPRPSHVQKTFGGENESIENFDLRSTFALELLNARNIIPSNEKTLQLLFDVIKQGNAKSDLAANSYQQNLAVNAVRKILEVSQKGKIGSSDIDMDCVIETMRSTHNHHLLRDCLRLIVAAARHTPASVVKHVMSVFTFMGNGLLRKDNELTLSIVEQTVESLFKTIISTSGSSKQQQIEKLIDLTRLFAASATDIPAHRRARIAHAIARAVGAENASIVVLVFVSSFCARWQRSTDAVAQEAAKRGSDQDAYDDLAIELLAALNPFEQLSSVLEMVEHVLRLGGDNVQPPKTTQTKKSTDELIFDRFNQTLPRIRHFRYIIVVLISRIFGNRTLIEKLAAYDDEELLKNALPLGKRLIECSVELDEFANKESNNQQNTDAQTQRYWVAFASRTEVVSEKLRHLLPGGVAARLIADVLQECINQKNIPFKMCEKVLQLANIKLGHDGYLFADSGINEKELIVLAEALNRFILPETKSEEKMRLCQNAAYTLKLIAKHLPTQSESKVLAETMQKCVNIVQQYQKLDENLTGNALLLAGELIRSHNMGSTIHHAINLLKTCLATTQECIVRFSKNSQFESPASSNTPGRGNRGQRIRQQSLGGNRFGSDTLLICSLTCIQRIFDQFSSFVCEYSGDVIIRYCRLIARFGDPTEFLNLNQPSSSFGSTSGFGSKSGIHHRLSLIRRALLTIEIRVLPGYISKVVVELKNEKKSLCALFNLLSGFIESQQQTKPELLRKSIVQLRNAFMSDIIQPSLAYRSFERNVEHFESVEKLEKSIYNFVVSIASVLSEVEFRPIVNSLVSWAENGLESSSSQESRVHLISLLHFANSLYDAFNSLALPYFGRILEIAVLVLKRSNATIISSSDELLLTGKRGSIEALETDFGLTSAIDLISNAARHKDFFTSDRCQLVSDVIIDELVNTKVEGHEKRCSEHLVIAIYRIGNADPDNFPDLLNKMMLKTRDSRAKIRYRTLLVLELLIDRIGDGVQPHLSILLPFLNELIEDENKQVEAQCQKVINALQHKFGETFWNSNA
ncbi:unnamed protein product [Caenorhabditis angaria]|uniref:HEAT repeat-containing protein 1 n=1 Tax=Caenorhabditis angaria TaxID=860376 RepID=A0A9P1IB23_9PELO|nr:unnamed protein product [Caenorhabditis angaria]